MTAMPATTRMTPDDLLAMPGGEGYELIDGIPVEKPTGAKSDEIALLVGTQLNVFVRPRRLGRVYGSQTGYQCFPDNPGRVRMPDASFVAAGRLTDDRTPDGYIKITPDLAVEVVSPNDLYEEVEEKIRDYRAAGVKLIWVISPTCRTVLVRRLDRTATALTEGDDLSGEDVVPGFTCKVAELFV